MAAIQIKGVDRELIWELKAAACRERKGLGAYVLDLLWESVRTPEVQERLQSSAPKPKE